MVGRRQAGRGAIDLSSAGDGHLDCEARMPRGFADVRHAFVHSMSGVCVYVQHDLTVVCMTMVALFAGQDA